MIWFIICGWLVCSVLDYFICRWWTRGYCKGRWTVGERNFVIIWSILFAPIVLATVIILSPILMMIDLIDFSDKPSKW